MAATELNDAKPIQTSGLEFIEFAAPNSHLVEQSLLQLGFVHVADHRHKNVRLYRQNDINFIINAEPVGQAKQFAELHGPTSNAIGFKVADIQETLQRATALDLEVVASGAGPMELNIPAVKTEFNTLIYLIEHPSKHSIYDIDFSFRSNLLRKPRGPLNSVDHVTYNVQQGQLESQVLFFKRNFGFSELQTFQIQGQFTGLNSVALISQCGKIRLPINEPSDPKSQIAEYLHAHNGSGIQHIALGTRDIFEAVDYCRKLGTDFQTTPDSYYDQLLDRDRYFGEIQSRLHQKQVLIDGSLDRGLLMQIFTKEMIGPMFFELIQREGNMGFGEGNFQALFESIEREQEQRGYFDEAV